MDDKRLYKETFSHVRTSATVNMEAYNKMKKNKTGRKILLVAAAVCLMAAIGITAYAADFLGLRSFLISDGEAETETENQPQTDENGWEIPEIPTTETSGVLSLQGYGNMPESQALLEWLKFLESYDPGPLTNEPTSLEDKYINYQVYDQTMADKLEEIAAKYNLKLHTRSEVLSQEQMDAVLGKFKDGTHSAGSAVCFENGGFTSDGDWFPPSGGTVAYQLVRTVRGTLTDTALYIRDTSSYAEWQYELAGRTFVLALNSYKGLILADLGDCFVTVNVLSGETEAFTSDYVTVDRETLEEMVGTFNWDALAQVAEPDFDDILATVPEDTEPAPAPEDSGTPAQPTVQDTREIPGDYGKFTEVLDIVYFEYQNEFLYYSVHDLDGDGVKELLVLRCTCEADFEWYVYYLGEYEGEPAALWAGSFPGGHSRLYARPEGGLYLFQGHMGSETLSVVTMEDGTVKREVVSERAVDFAAGEDYTVPSGEELKTAYITDYGLLIDGNPTVFHGWQTVDGESRSAAGRIVLLSAVTGAEAEALLDGTQPALKTGQEYVVATFEVYYDDGDEKTLDLTENHASHISSSLYFALSNGDGNAEDISGSVQDGLLGKVVPIGGSVTGRVAFIREKGTDEPIIFVGFGTVMEYDF
ncbi:MAG: hypothetical protein ACI3VB_00255 [Oscillospiraceae bacterium]